MIEKDENGNILIRQGDTGEIIFGDNNSGFNPDYNFIVYFSVRDENGNLMFPEIMTTTNNSMTATITLDADTTDLLTVPEGEETAIYYWGLKAVKSGSDEEHTIYPKLGQKCLMIVYRKYVEGPKQ